MWRDPLTSSVASYQENASISCYNGASNPGTIVRTEGGYTSRFEAMYSEVGLRREHPCQHYVVGRTLLPGRWTFYNSDSGFYQGPTFPYRIWTQGPKTSHYGKFWGNVNGFGPYGHIVDPVTDLPVLYVPYTAQNGGVQTPSNYGDLKSYALNSMLPQIRPRLSLINSIYELKDFKSLARSVLRLSRSYGSLNDLLSRGRVNFRTWMRGQIQRYREAPLRRILRSSADGWLQYHFAWRPLVSDIIAVKAAIYETRKQIENLLAREGLPQEHHFRRSLSEQYVDKDEVTVAPKSGYYSDCSTIWGSCRYTRLVVHTNPIFQGTIHYSYELDEWSRQHAAMNGFLDALGVRLDPAIIWNAIPWTFVIDWVAGVSSWLKSFARSNLDPRTHITGCTFSIKVDRRIATTFQGSYNTGGPQGNVIPVLDMHEIAYRRDLLCAEDYKRSLQLSGLNLREFSLAAALGLTRLRG